jgi:hypothetical protein
VQGGILEAECSHLKKVSNFRGPLQSSKQEGLEFVEEHLSAELEDRGLNRRGRHKVLALTVDLVATEID